jgi:hypothetical protein
MIRVGTKKDFLFSFEYANAFVTSTSTVMLKYGSENCLKIGFVFSFIKNIIA